MALIDTEGVVDVGATVVQGPLFGVRPHISFNKKLSYFGDGRLRSYGRYETIQCLMLNTVVFHLGLQVHRWVSRNFKMVKPLSIVINWEPNAVGGY